MTGMLALALAAPAAAAGRSDLWLHVKVDDDDARVRVNVPLSLVEEMLPAIEVDELRGGKLRIDAIDTGELEGVDLRELWRAVNELGDTEFVKVDGDDEQLRVYKEGDLMRLDVEGDGDEKVAIRIPLDVVGALFSGEPGELDLLAALAALGRHTGTDLITVQNGDKQVRVWVDSKSTAE
jgi:hypothetical protein